MRAVDEMMVLEIAPRGAGGGGAAPAVADVDRVAVAARGRGGGRSGNRWSGGGSSGGRGRLDAGGPLPRGRSDLSVPGEYEFLQEGEQADPGGDAAAARGKRPGRKSGGARLRIRPRIVPRDALDFVRQAATSRFDDGEQVVGEIVRQAESEENVRAGERNDAATGEPRRTVRPA